MIQRKRAKAGVQRRTAQNSGRTAGRRPDGLPVGRPFPEGVSGNPGGRPKSAEINRALRARLSEQVPGDPEGRSHAEVIADEMVSRAMAGDLGAATFVRDGVEGRPRQGIEVGRLGSYSLPEDSKELTAQLLEHLQRPDIRALALAGGDVADGWRSSAPKALLALDPTKVAIAAPNTPSLAEKGQGETGC